jgi:hypothetical protein
MLTALELQRVLNDFRNRNPQMLQDDRIGGVKIVFSGELQDDDSIALEVSRFASEGITPYELGISDVFESSILGRKLSIPVRLVPARLYQAYDQTPINTTLLRPSAIGGVRVWAKGSTGTGTLGWAIELYNVLVGISNWHVLCPQQNQTPLGTDVFAELNGNTIRIGSLYYYDSLYSSGNVFDFAMVRLEIDIIKEMRSCDNSLKLHYPMRLGYGNELTRNQIYWKVGARQPICREGVFKGLGDVKVEYNDGTIRSFKDQLIFSKMSDEGDSGSIIYDRISLKVFGLNFAGNPNETIANPLYRKGWQFNSSVEGNEIPSFLTENRNSEIILQNRELENITNLVSGIFSSNLPPIFTPGVQLTCGRIDEILGRLHGTAEVIQGFGASNWLCVRVHYMTRLEGRPPQEIKRYFDGWLDATTGVFWGDARKWMPK